MKAPLASLIAALALAGCGQPADKAAVAPATEATLPADAPKAQQAWSATPVGVGPLTADTPFSRDAIAALFPGSEVKNAFVSEEGDQVPIITVNGPDELVLEIQGGSTGKVDRIYAQGGPVVGPRGEKLLDPWQAMGFKTADCIMGADRASGAALCRRPGAPTLAYVFGAPGGGLGDTEQEPNAEVIAEKGFLREFYWHAPISN